MPTLKQEKAFKKIMENHGNISKGMVAAGYSLNTAKNPLNLTESRGWQELLQQYLPENELTEIHKKLLNKEEIIIKTNRVTKKLEIIKTGQPHSDVKGALDMAYKLHGKYVPEKQELSFKDLSDEQLREKIADRLVSLLTDNKENNP